MEISRQQETPGRSRIRSRLLCRAYPRCEHWLASDSSKECCHRRTGPRYACCDRLVSRDPMDRFSQQSRTTIPTCYRPLPPALPCGWPTLQRSHQARTPGTDGFTSRQQICLANSIGVWKPKRPNARWPRPSLIHNTLYTTNPYHQPSATKALPTTRALRRRTASLAPISSYMGGRCSAALRRVDSLPVKRSRRHKQLFANTDSIMGGLCSLNRTLWSLTKAYSTTT